MKKMDLKKYGIAVNINSDINLNEFGHIYLFKNILNNKIYIGQSINITRRIKNHLKCRIKKNISLLTTALIKYGISNFEISIIDSAQTIDELNEKEIFYIKKYNSNAKTLGYNIESGGKNSIPSEETLKKMSISHKGIKQNEEWVIGRISSAGSEEAKKYGRPKTEKEKKNLSKNSTKFWEGKTRNEETRKKISETKKAKGFTEKQIQANCKTVYKYDVNTGEKINEYISIAEICKNENMTSASVSRWCSKNAIRNGYLWSYELLSIDEIKEINNKTIKPVTIIKEKQPKIISQETRGKLSQAAKGRIQSEEWIEKRIEQVSKPVLKINVKTNEIIEKFPSLADAGRNNNDNLIYGRIKELCHGTGKNTGDFIWCYEENYMNNTIPQYKEMNNRKFDSLSDDELDMINKEYDNGISLRQLSKNYNINFLSLSNYFKKKEKPESIFKENTTYIAKCIKTGKELKYSGNSSGLTMHIQETYPDLLLESKFKRKQIELKTGKPWFYDYFEFNEA